MKKVHIIDCGMTSYNTAWGLQQKLFDRVTEKRNINYFILTEHPPVITIGKSGTRRHLLAAPKYLKQHHIDLVETDRGGDITFHGPGQLVGYPILDLNGFRKDVHWYLRMLEEVIIGTLEYFDIKGGRFEGLTGVWVGDQKICAMGIKVTRWVTMHGFALNVNTDLSYFQHIVPCGINDKGVTSISGIVGNNVDINLVISKLRGHFERVFEVTCISEPYTLHSTN